MEYLEMSSLFRWVLCLYYWKITHPWHNCVVGFCLGPRATQEAWCSVQNGFDLESESEARCQHGNLFDSIKTGFLPNIAPLSALDGVTEEMTVWLMCNWPSQITSDLIGLLTEAGVRVITFAPSTTQTFQVFDITSLMFSNGIQDMNWRSETRKWPWNS
jgi:hypothetical protein